MEPTISEKEELTIGDGSRWWLVAADIGAVIGRTRQGFNMPNLGEMSLADVNLSVMLEHPFMIHPQMTPDRTGNLHVSYNLYPVCLLPSIKKLVVPASRFIVCLRDVSESERMILNDALIRGSKMQEAMLASPPPRPQSNLIATPDMVGLPRKR